MLLSLLYLLPVALHLPLKLADQPGFQGCIKDCIYRVRDNTLRIPNMIICRKCKCFKRHIESEDENLMISTQFQNFLDDMLSDGESEYSNISLSSSSENNLSELDDMDYYL